MFLAEGPHLVDELLRSGLAARQVLHTSEAAADAEVREILERCRNREIPVEEVPPGELEEFADTVTPRGVLAVAEIPARDRGDLGRGDWLVLDAIQDPGNLGTILRTAEALGATGAVSLPGTVDPWNPKVVRASAGSIFRVPVVNAGLEELAGWLREASLELWAADPEGEPVGRDLEAPSRLALVLGNEGAGVREEILSTADRRVAVRLRGPVESLNVAMAAAILMDRIFSARRA